MWYVLNDAGNPEQSRIVVPASMGGGGGVVDEDEDDIDLFTMDDRPSYIMDKCMHRYQFLPFDLPAVEGCSLFLSSCSNSSSNCSQSSFDSRDKLFSIAVARVSSVIVFLVGVGGVDPFDIG